MNVSYENTNKIQEWYTPIDYLEGLGIFDLDPCTCKKAIEYNDTAKSYYDTETDGLSKEWYGRVWLNPPYDNISKFLLKMVDHNNGMALVFNRSDTDWFHNLVIGRASALFLFNKRISFINENLEIKKGAGAASMLVVYGKNNLHYFRNYKKKGALILL